VNEEEIDRLIVELRALLRETGFAWAGEQAEAALSSDSSSYWIARALIDAAEAVTAELAGIEAAATRVLGVDEIIFKRDPDVDGDGGDEAGDGDRGVAPGSIAEVPDGGDRLRGPQRRAAIQTMAGYSSAFAELRGRLDGLV
jgi:hypothetical protein